MRNIQLGSDEGYALKDVPAEWPEWRSARALRLPAEDLGIRRLLEFPEAVHPIRKLPITPDPFDDPDWPDAA